MGRTDKAGSSSRGGGEAAAAFRAVQLHHGDLDAAPGGRGFGSGALKAGGRIFASLSGDRLLLKLPAERVDALIAEGTGERFTTGPGRPKREWVTIALSQAPRWVALSGEARAFVADGLRD